MLGVLLTPLVLFLCVCFIMCGSRLQVTISNDGATIMKMLDIAHPAAKTLVDISMSQDAEVRRYCCTYVPNVVDTSVSHDGAGVQTCEN